VGFLSTALSSLLNLRIETKRRKKINPDYAGIDWILKWMLVTCFGYTGYRNAKFGQIQVHEKITEISRELLLQIKEIAEGMDLEVLHGKLWTASGCEEMASWASRRRWKKKRKFSLRWIPMTGSLFCPWPTAPALITATLGG
jgi:hypothetical protein